MTINASDYTTAINDVFACCYPAQRVLLRRKYRIMRPPGAVRAVRRSNARHAVLNAAVRISTGNPGGRKASTAHLGREARRALGWD
jgi:hypothetical protein